MAVFYYTARTLKGEKVEGTIEADDRPGALRQLERMRHIPIHVGEKPADAKGTTAARFAFSLGFGGQRLSARDLLIFTTELRDLLGSGMKLGNALAVLARRKTGGASDVVLASLRDDIIQGKSLSAALAEHPRSFPVLYVSMVRAGEASGALGEVLGRLVAHFERLQEVKEKVITAMVYPIIVLVLGAATLVFSMVFIIPRFSAIFVSLGQTLPLPTRMLVGFSGWMTKYGLVLGAAIAIGVMLFLRAIRTPQGKLRWHGILLRLPLIRGIVSASSYTQFAQTLSTLLANGVPVLQALGIVEQTVQNAVIAAEIHNAKNRVTDGTSISGPLEAGKVFPSIMTDMLAVGEQTGDLPASLNHISRRYQNELDRNVKIFTTALEPLLIVLMAAVVGFVAISMLLAVFSLTNGLNMR